MNTEIIVQNQLTLMNECYQCQQLNELCSDCLEAKEARDAVIAHKLIDEYETMYLNMATIQDEPSAHDWISAEVVSIELSKHECICSVCHYTINKHAVCPNCN